MNGIFFASLIAFFLSLATLQGSTGMTSSAPGTLSGVPAHAESDLIERIRQAIVDGSVEDLLGIRTELRLRTEAQEAKAESSDHYTLAYINWRICQLLPENEKKERRQLLKQAQRELDSILEADPSDAEAHALRGSLIGERIGGFLGGMFLGPKASKSLKRAFELDPTNPRVALQRGVSSVSYTHLTLPTKRIV